MMAHCSVRYADVAFFSVFRDMFLPWYFHLSKSRVSDPLHVERSGSKTFHLGRWESLVHLSVRNQSQQWNSSLTDGIVTVNQIAKIVFFPSGSVLKILKEYWATRKVSFPHISNDDKIENDGKFVNKNFWMFLKSVTEDVYIKLLQGILVPFL